MEHGTWSLLLLIVGELTARSRNLSINEEDFQEATDGKSGAAAGDGDAFRRRTRSAPPAFWAAKKYGRELRRMSDEFDTLLDKGVKKIIKNHTLNSRAGKLIDGLKLLADLRNISKHTDFFLYSQSVEQLRHVWCTRFTSLILCRTRGRSQQVRKASSHQFSTMQTTSLNHPTHASETLFGS